jgi:histidyl-tRNA synthetase
MEAQGVETPQGKPLIAVVGAAPENSADRLRVANRLRDAGLTVRPDGSARRLGKQLETAAKVGARWAVIVGDEVRTDQVTLRDLDSGDQRLVLVPEVRMHTSSANVTVG